MTVSQAMVRLPHADTPLAIVMNSSAMPSLDSDPRRRAGIPMSSTQLRSEPPPAYQGTFHGVRLAAEHDWPCPEVVVKVRMAVPAVAPVMVTGLVDAKLKMGAATAPAGPDVIAAVSPTLPMNPPTGDTETVDVFPVVAPGATETAVPVTVKVGFAGTVTVTDVAPLELL